MNKRFLVLIATGAAFATIFAAGCAAHKRVTVSTLPSTVSTTVAVQQTTTRPSITEPTVIKNGIVYRELPVQTTAKATEATTTTAAPTAKPTNKPTAKPTKKPTAKPTKKPTAKPTKKPTAKPTAKPVVKAGTLAAAPQN